MIRNILILFLLFAAPAFAGPVLVKSGEHDGFTRLVMDYGVPVSWQLGRTEDGYELRIVGREQVYDLTDAFKLIGKSRLAAIWSDPSSGHLRLGIACACHAIPFEFRPGIIVIDIRNGPPPKGSSFELALNGAGTDMLADRPIARPRPRPASAVRGFDWTTSALAEMDNGRSRPIDGTLMPAADPVVASIRGRLLRDLATGAANGVVDLTLPAAKPPPQATDAASPGVAVAFGDLPGIVASLGLPQHDDLGAQGESCIDAADLDLAGWVSDAPIAIQIAEAHKDLVGEFDEIDPVALRRAVTFDLAIGFGAEARQLLNSFSVNLPEKQIWIGLSYLVEGEMPPDRAFAGQAACNSPAALWAVMSNPHLTKGDTINRGAAYAAFSGLPLNLRRQLAPAVVNRFLALGDKDTATMISNAVLRAPGQTASAVALMQAEMEIVAGDPTAAEARLLEIIDNSGPETPSALVALADLRTAQDLPVSSELVTSLRAIVQETAGQPQSLSVQRSLIWAEGAAGDFASAFAALSEDPDAGPRLWRLLALIGSDEAILDWAVLSESQTLPQSDEITRAKLARRLQDLGLPDAALKWAEAANPADPILLAQIHLSRHDGRKALSALASLKGADANRSRAEALLQLGDPAAAAAVFAAADSPQDELRALAGARSWQDVADRGLAPWQALAATLTPVPTPAGEGSLARALRFAEASAATRQDVQILLTAVSMP